MAPRSMIPIDNENMRWILPENGCNMRYGNDRISDSRIDQIRMLTLPEVAFLLDFNIRRAHRTAQSHPLLKMRPVRIPGRQYSWQKGNLILNIIAL
jgi:hypothetical protein